MFCFFFLCFFFFEVFLVFSFEILICFVILFLCFVFHDLFFKSRNRFYYLGFIF